MKRDYSFMIVLLTALLLISFQTGALACEKILEDESQLITVPIEKPATVSDSGQKALPNKGESKITPAASANDADQGKVEPEPTNTDDQPEVITPAANSEKENEHTDNDKKDLTN